MLFEEEYEEPLGRDESYTTVSVEEYLNAHARLQHGTDSGRLHR